MFTFKVGEEVTCKINGMRGYIIESFTGVVIRFEGSGKIRIISERHIVEDEEGRANFGLKTGQIMNKKTFYVIHLTNGEVKIATGEVLLKGHQKIVPSIPGILLRKDLN